MRNRLMLMLIAAVVLAADQISKQLVLRSLRINESWSPIPGLSRFFSFTYTTNTGAAFGLFPDRGGLFIVIAIVVIIAIVIYYRYLPANRLLVRISLGLQLGGATGNLLDRLRYGHVIDFLDFKVWPVFNFADSAIVVGVVLLAYYLLTEGDGEQEIDTPDDSPPNTPSRMPTVEVDRQSET